MRLIKMRFIKICIAALLLLALGSCNNGAVKTESLISDVSDGESVIHEEQEHQNLIKNAILDINPNINDWMTVNVPELGLKNLIIGSKEEGKVTTYKHTLPVYIFHDYCYGSDSIYHDSYLAVVTESKILFYDLSSDRGSNGDSLYLCELDGDGLDEIILHQCVGMTGGAGSYISRIFKVINNEIIEIFNSPDYNGSIEDGVSFDTGFAAVLKNGFKMEIKNKFTGYKKTLDLSAKKEIYLDAFFDKYGKVIKSDRTEGDWITVDSFFEFVPKDVDRDGIFEIVCLQYVSFLGIQIISETQKPF